MYAILDEFVRRRDHPSRNRT